MHHSGDFAGRLIQHLWLIYAKLVAALSVLDGSSHLYFKQIIARENEQAGIGKCEILWSEV